MMRIIKIILIFIIEFRYCWLLSLLLLLLDNRDRETTIAVPRQMRVDIFIKTAFASVSTKGRAVESIIKRADDGGRHS